MIAVRNRDLERPVYRNWERYPDFWELVDMFDEAKEIRLISRDSIDALSKAQLNGILGVLLPDSKPRIDVPSVLKGEK